MAEPFGDKKQDGPTRDRDTAGSTAVTGEVASEGGTPGDVELVDESTPGTGSEATETFQPAATRKGPVARDETGVGRRSP